MLDGRPLVTAGGLSCRERLFYPVLLATSFAGVLISYLPGVIGQPLSLWWSELVQTLSYFTIISNLAVALLALGQLCFAHRPWALALGTTAAKTAIAVYISVTGIVYHGLLADYHDPAGIESLSAFLTHTLTPVLYVLFWFACVRGGKMALQGMLPMLWVPVLFLLYWLIRGPIVGGYPYYFIDVDRYGYMQVFLNAVGLCLAFWLLGVAYWATSTFSVVDARTVSSEDLPD